MGLLIPFLILGGLVAIASGSSKSGRGLNPDGFIYDNVYEVQSGDAAVSTLPHPIVGIVAPLLSTEQCADVIEPFAEDYPGVFFLIVSEDNFDTVEAELGEFPVFTGTLLLMTLTPGGEPGVVQVALPSAAGLEVGLESVMDWYDGTQEMASSTGGTRGLRGAQSVGTRSVSTRSGTGSLGDLFSDRSRTPR